MQLAILPKIKDRQHYSILFKEDFHWDVAIAHLMQKHGLKGKPIRGVRGSHIVYRVGDVWIKLMAPLFAKDMAFELAGLACAKNSSNVKIPEILEEGELEGWSYVILSHVEGERIGDLYFNLPIQEQLKLAGQIANTTKSLHQAKANTVVMSRGDWNQFIQERFKNLVIYHKNKNLEGDWLLGLQDFMSKFKVSEFLCANPVFIHADLTWDHFLINKSSGGYKITGVIDFADCRLGHPEYDMVASTAFLFKGKRELMEKYLMVIGIRDGLDERFSEKLLAWTALHLFSDLKGYFLEEMRAVPAGDFSSLARKVYPI